MALYTIKDLEKMSESYFLKNLPYNNPSKEASAKLLESANGFSADEEYDIFMSHSFLDAEYIYMLKKDIEYMGFSVYVDWCDDSQLDRSKVTIKTANLLRKRMKNCKSLLYIASEKSKQSKWMPWELGYFDGIKNKVAILPVLNTSTNTDNFNGQEYLGLYPYITKNRIQFTNQEILYVNTNNDETTYASFEGWINGKNLRKH